MPPLTNRTPRLRLQRRLGRGFTLVELLVVLTIVALISAAALPVVLPALNERKISEAARLLQAVLAGARDTAVRAGAPRGIRFLIDPIFNGTGGQALASNRMIAIEPGPDYAEGMIRTPGTTSTSTFMAFGTSISDVAYSSTYLRVAASPEKDLISNAPTGWSYNIRQGDKIRFDDSGNYYTIAGPIAPTTKIGTPDLVSAATNNPERFIQCATSTPIATSSNISTWVPEYLNLTNGLDDDADGWVDESCDGIDNDGDGIIDPGFNGIDDNGDGYVDEAAELTYNAIIGGASTVFNEYETEVFVGVQASHPPSNDRYIISRRPVVSPGARETTLPDGIVIDLTTWNASAATPGGYSPTYSATVPQLPERSRLPVDPYTGFVDILIAPNGQVVAPAVGGGTSQARSPVANSPFYHFWLTEREGVNAPLWNKADGTLMPNPGASSTTDKRTYLLPMPKGTVGLADSSHTYAPMVNNPNNGAQNYSANPVFLTGQRRLVTLFSKTGQTSSTSIVVFDVNDTSRPFYDAQAGIKESQ